MQMRKIFIAMLLVLTMPAMAQRAKEEIKADRNLAASNYLAYPGPKQKLTKAPEGYTPYYISHYGRHGSRYLISPAQYSDAVNILAKADSLDKLSPRGHDVLDKVRMLAAEAQGRLGELTPLGAEQHRDIAHRMYMRFPQVFNGNVHVDARSTIVIRCILSMGNELMELARLNPRMVITSDASQHDMYYMNDEHGKYNKLRDTPEARQALADFNKNHENYSHLMGLLFNDTAYAHTIDANKLGQRLFDLAANIQSTELRHKFSLWPIFTDKEVYDSWQRKNAMWYMYYGPSRQAHSYGLLTQANLLNNIITTADSCLLLQHPGATLRFAHESDVMPLVCLLNLNHYGETIDDLEQLDDRGWNNYDIYPMACNVQFIFYKPSTATDLSKADILVKVLLNENETALPVSTDKAPYYHWKDVRAYLLQRLDQLK